MFKDNPDFYPTPKRIIDKMLSGIDFKLISSVLEPSAGKGNIVDAVIDKLKYSHSYSYNKNVTWDIDTIEIDKNLQYILQGKNYRVVHDDFLTFNSYKKYDIIIMNPPFSTGDKHLLKALEMQERHGGQIVCLLNSETLNNLYSNSRKDLFNRLDKYNAKIEFINDAFIDAERKTPVQIALIKIDIPKTEQDSIILNELKKQEQYEKIINTDNNKIVDADFIKAITEQYNFEVRTGLKLISEYEALKPYMLNSFKDEGYITKESILQLKLKDEDKYSSKDLRNGYIEQIRMKYWKALFTSEEFMGLFTSNLRDKYYNKIKELKDYDFSLFNIYTIKINLNKEMIQGVEDTILKLFEEFSNRYHWMDETSNNIHYYNGWKTNKSYKINKKVIIPLNGFGWSGFESTKWEVKEKLADVEKVFNYLDCGKTDHYDIYNALDWAKGEEQTRKIKLKYFLITFYKKGTCHIEFTNMDLLQKFNLYGSQRMGWLPPSYGKSKYKDMTPEEKQVINDFEGELSYNKVMHNRDYFIVDSSKLLMLA